MNTRKLATYYRQLTPEERFCLIMAAGGRGDDTEQARLIQASQKIPYELRDHVPYSHAICEVGRWVYLELIEEAHRYRDAFQKSGERGPFEGHSDDLRSGERWLRLALAAGFALKTKATGWELFCQKRGLPVFCLWEDWPGYRRLRTAIALTERAAFTAEGFLRYLNEIGDENLLALPFTSEGIAEAHERAFQDRVRWWGG